jgi:tetratricopeptide (TPR) repeat protein
MGELDRAKEDFDKALDHDINDPQTYYNRGNVFLNMDPKQYD